MIDDGPENLPEFHLSSEGMVNPETESEPIEAKPRSDLVAKYSLFKEELDPKTDVVYHPCGSNDVSPSIAFPDSRVIYADIDEKAVEALKRGGYEAHAASALEFDPGEVNILIMLNPAISPNIPSSYVVGGGFVLCNDYHQTASILRQDNQYQLQAMIRVLPDGKLIFDKDNLEDCWQEIDSDEEFKNVPFSWGVVNYETAARIVESITGKRENILDKYKKIIEKARKQQDEENARLLAEHPEWKESLGNLEDDDVLIFNHNGRQYILETRIPNKKGTVDDIFVFQKTKTSRDFQAPD